MPFFLEFPLGLFPECFRKPQRISEKHVFGQFRWYWIESAASCKTGSNHAERCRICSQVCLRVLFAVVISRTRALNDHSSHWNHLNRVEDLFQAILSNNSFWNDGVVSPTYVGKNHQGKNAPRPMRYRNRSKWCWNQEAGTGYPQPSWNHTQKRNISRNLLQDSLGELPIAFSKIDHNCCPPRLR